MIAAMVRILFGFALACLAGALTQVLFVITPADLYSLEGDARWQRMGFAGMITLSAATQSAVFALPFAVAAIVFGIVQGVRGWAFYVFVGLAIALLGFSALYASEGSGQPTIANSYAVAAFAFSGIIAGYVYWLVAGHRAGAYRMREEPVYKAAEQDTGREHLKAKDYDQADRLVRSVPDPGAHKTH
jgi:signal transduction histidine kinase